MPSVTADARREGRKILFLRLNDPCHKLNIISLHAGVVENPREDENFSSEFLMRKY